MVTLLKTCRRILNNAQSTSLFALIGGTDSFFHRAVEACPHPEAFTHLFHPLPSDQVPAATLRHPSRGFQNPTSYSCEEASYRSASTEQTLPCRKRTEAQCMGLFLATWLFPGSSPGPNAAECKAETLGEISQAQRWALSVKPATCNPSEDGLLSCMWMFSFPALSPGILR